MHTVTQYAPLAIMLAIGWAADYRNKRPAARARWTALSLRGKIARNIRTARLGGAFHAGWLVLAAGLRVSGLLDFHSWLAGTIAAGVMLAVHLFLLRHALAMRRTYDALGPLAYLAEVQHAFGTSTPAQPSPTERLAAAMPEVFGTSAPGSDQSEVTS